MPNPFFRFKQFTVFHDLCAMKVGTDGVLLGAWADCLNAQTILDIGTGSGLIALMLAQRSKSVITAIDIEESAYIQAGINFKKSPFNDRLNIYHASIQQFSTSTKYDLIVSNPPYFSNSLQSPDASRTHARHNDSLSLDDLIKHSQSLLSPKGKLALILPFDIFEQVNDRALEHSLFLCRKTQVCPTPSQAPKRILLEYSMEKQPIVENELFIEKSRHVYSEEYRNLTSKFYLKS